MTEESWNKLDEKSIVASREGGAFLLAVYLVANVIIYLMLDYFEFPIWIIWIPIILTILSIPYELILDPKWRYESRRYRICETDIQIKKGKFFQKKILIPMGKVQHIELEQGPIVKRHQLMRVTISTAAGTHHISGIAEDVAECICTEINHFAGLYDEQI